MYNKGQPVACKWLFGPVNHQNATIYSAACLRGLCSLCFVDLAMFVFYCVCRDPTVFRSQLSP